MSIDPRTIEDRILELLSRRPAGPTISPMDVACSLGGAHPDGWGPLMPAIRRAAIGLMKQGRILILRKGRPVDPDGFRGTYRLGLPGGEG